MIKLIARDERFMAFPNGISAKVDAKDLTGI